MRWFPAMVSNHVMDLIERYGFDSEIPAALTDFVKAREFYNYEIAPVWVPSTASS